jgi:hypothetical protein
VVITGLTRNQFVFTDTWVRIPHPPPYEPCSKQKPLGINGFCLYIMLIAIFIFWIIKLSLITAFLVTRQLGVWSYMR